VRTGASQRHGRGATVLGFRAGGTGADEDQHLTGLAVLLAHLLGRARRKLGYCLAEVGQASHGVSKRRCTGDLLLGGRPLFKVNAADDLRLQFCSVEFTGTSAGIDKTHLPK
jgi:hypothetical protein